MKELGENVYSVLDQVKAIRLYRYELPFKEPLQVGRKLLEIREGWILQLIDRQDRSGFGEISPLPGYSRESLSEVEQELQYLLQHKGTPGQHPWSPSVTFGLETACYYLKKNQKPSVSSTSSVVQKTTITVNALLQPDPQQLNQQISELLTAGFKTIKMKVGRRAIGDDIDIVNRVTAMLPHDVLLRLDANGLWNYDRALIFGHAVDTSSIEYIEEPFPETSLLPQFYQNVYIPCALDERLSLIDIRQRTPQIPQGVQAFILKPTMLGGITKTMGYLRLARAKGIQPVISSCYEVGPGFSFLTELAASDAFTGCVCGLDTLKYLSHHLLPQPLEIHNGAITIDTTGPNTALESLDMNPLTLQKEQVYP